MSSIGAPNIHLVALHLALKPHRFLGTKERRSTQTVRAVDAGLESLLGQLTAAPGRWIFIIEDARTPCHYLQAVAYEDGSLLSEVTSNYFLDPLRDTSHRWEEAREDSLAA